MRSSLRLDDFNMAQMFWKHKMRLAIVSMQGEEKGHLKSLMLDLYELANFCLRLTIFPRSKISGLSRGRKSKQLVSTCFTLGVREGLCNYLHF